MSNPHRHGAHWAGAWIDRELSRADDPPRFSGAQQGHVLRRWLRREWPPTWAGLVMGALAFAALFGPMIMGWA